MESCYDVFYEFFKEDAQYICELINAREYYELEEKWGEEHYDDFLDKYSPSVDEFAKYVIHFLVNPHPSIPPYAISQIMKMVAFLFKDAYYDHNAGIGHGTSSFDWFFAIREQLRPHIHYLELYLDHQNSGLRMEWKNLIEEWKEAEQCITRGRSGFAEVNFSYKTKNNKK